MSDPTARRGDNITAMLDAMKKSKRGWSQFQMTKFLLVRYRFGVRKATIDGIIQQLKDSKIIISKPIRADSTVVLFHVSKNYSRL